MPFFSCPICGWATTASLAQASRAHELGVPGCDGILEQLAYAGRRTGPELSVPGADDRLSPSTALSDAMPDEP